MRQAHTNRLVVCQVHNCPVWDIWSHRHEAGRVEYNSMIFVSELSLLLIIVGIRTIFIEGHNLPNKALLFYAFVILIAVGTFGRTYGLYVQVSGSNHCRSQGLRPHQRLQLGAALY
jgi:hypothetical protein